MNDCFAIMASWVFIWGITFMFVEPPIYPITIAHADKVCGQNGGWKMIKEGYTVDATVYCNNGAEFDYDVSEIHKEKSE